jgi:GAF domain-containing protein
VSLETAPGGSIGAIGRTAQALVGATTLPELAQGALEDVRAALALEVAALYLSAGDDPLVVDRFAVATTTARQVLERLVFDSAAWRLATCGRAPLVIRDGGIWLVEHPFSPPAAVWLLLPLATGIFIATNGDWT